MMINRLYKKLLRVLIKYHILMIDFENEKDIDEFFHDLHLK